jgi:outer membrane immunogenic protein
MRSVVLATILLLGAAGIAVGQALPSGAASFSGGDAALTYHWVRTNTLGSCGCFSLNGVGLSATWAFRPPFAAVAEASVEHTASGPSGSSLTLTTYMAGVRYVVLQPSKDRTRGLQGFAQLLAGGGHAGGGVAGPGDSTNSFVGRIGGGLDWPINRRFTARIIQADYYLTAFNNGANNHQNNTLIGAGIVYLWSH